MAHGILKARAFRAAFWKYDYEKGKELFHKLMASGDDSTLTLWGLAYCYHGMEKDDEAIKYANRVLENEPNHFHILMLLAGIYSNKQDHENTISYVERGLANQPPAPGPFPIWIEKMIKITGPEKMGKKLKEDWEMEPEDRDWIKWAKEYKEWYENEYKNKNVT